MAEEKNSNSIPFYPDHITNEAKVALGFGIILILIGIYGIFFPVGLGEPADPMNTPAHAKPEWYFLFLYQLLKFVPESVGAAAPVIALGILAVWPFLDSKSDQSPKAKKVRFVLAFGLTLIIILLSIWGEVS